MTRRKDTNEPEPPDGAELLAPSAAAEYLGIGPDLLRDWRHAGKGPTYIKFGHRTIRYRRGDLERFIANRMIKPHGAR